MESKRPALLKLCWMINKQLKAELAYSRAQYRVSYYRKLKARLEKSSKTSEKWSDHTELSKKIESCRLGALRRQEDLMLLNNRQRKDMAIATQYLESIITRYDAKITGVVVPTASGSQRNSNTWKRYELNQVEEMADQYEADTAMNRILTNKGNKQQ